MLVMMITSDSLYFFSFLEKLWEGTVSSINENLACATLDNSKMNKISDNDHNFDLNFKDDDHMGLQIWITCKKMFVLVWPQLMHSWKI